ncbi:hypothetical protein [Streptomyces clavifer]|uniref:hypothetical protein n=1 Tax=Streptomyces clavifer TaxID=68188 RepID=UPI003F4BBD92
MPWSWGRALPLMPPQTAFFAAAALWSCSTACSHRRGSRRTTTGRSMQPAWLRWLGCPTPWRAPRMVGIRCAKPSIPAPWPGDPRPVT